MLGDYLHVLAIEAYMYESDEAIPIYKGYPGTPGVIEFFRPTKLRDKDFIFGSVFQTVPTDVGFALAVKETISGGSTTEIKPQNNAYGSGFYNSNVDQGSSYRVRLSDVVYRTPSTTSATTYEVGVFGYNSTSIRLNADSSKGEIILMEIAG